MRWEVTILGVLLVACVEEPDEDACIFDGRYEMGALSRVQECSSTSETLYLADTEDECSTSIDQFGLTGARQSGYISCMPGDPVVDCSGFMNDSDGCSFDVYMRRVAP